MASIDRQQNESIDRMLSRFRRIMLRKGTLKQLRESMHFRKPISKRGQKLKAIYREEQRRIADRQTA